MTASAVDVRPKPPRSIALGGSADAAVAHVGAKAASLMRLIRAGFPVPDGIVLTTEFFAPWTERVRTAREWQSVCERLERPEEGGARDGFETCKRLAAGLSLSDAQGATLDQISHAMRNRLLAVRSSSPEEDLESASFAGLYETVLNVTAASLPDAVRACFASCLDERVLRYKLGQGLPIEAPRLAVIVQAQVASEVSGVAFSLDPITNDFDHAVVNASWGLGEALVRGELEPDTYIVDKVAGEVVEHRYGRKGGDRPDEPCLSSEQAAALVVMVKSIETLFACPVDVEWAFAGSRVHILQARPVTTYLPLPTELRTEPGEPRLLYMDAALSKGLTLGGAITPMTSSVLLRVVQLTAEAVLGRKDFQPDAKAGFFGPAGARWYINLSHLMHLVNAKDRRVIDQVRLTDATIADIYETRDLTAYRPRHPPSALRTPALLLAMARMLWGMRGFLFGTVARLVRRNGLAERYRRDVARFERVLAERSSQRQSIDALLRHYGPELILVAKQATAPALILAFYFGNERLKQLMARLPTARHSLGDAIQRGYPGELVVEMGTLMHRLSRLLPKGDFCDLDALATKLERRDLPEQFLAAWDEFIQRFGCRGPLEMEIARPRYADEPKLALQQIASLARGAGAFDPDEVRRRHVAQREAAFAELLAELKGHRRRQLQRAYRNIVEFGGTRDTPKHHIALIVHRVRERLLEEADVLVTAGRLDTREDIFELTLEDLEEAARNARLDLRAIHAARSREYRQTTRRVKHFPQMIDSRGRIVRPVRSAAPGELPGTPVSRGVASGPVKILHDPLEKEVLAGDVLVAYTTDPGWTPLFMNAAALVLEVGGELQHGALIAREYGKPCLVGVEQATTRLQDGQTVVVDADSGVVRLLSRSRDNP